ncbi:hydroxyacylglutathione hydrolase [Tardiphaga sp.]|uniref:hydroxyacylglutathione hydrolase n=1 Tax=Tardiphaga sp. TaxID=1926292 RepID=UPI00352A12B7
MVIDPLGCLGEIVQFPCLEDNYGFLIRDASSGQVVAIDTPDAVAILAVLDERKWPLDYILNTHWHADHVGGNAALKLATGARVVAPQIEMTRIPDVDIAIGDGAIISLGALEIVAMATSGHTLGHMSFYIPKLESIFVGDTLFVMGCGRIFEGTSGMMWHSLAKIAALPDQTRVYCAHEYSAANALFAVTIDDSTETLARAEHLLAMRDRGEPTVPTTVGIERKTNPFLRLPDKIIGSAEVKAAQFARLRAQKDKF